MVDARTFRHVLGHYPTGVCVVTSDDGGDPIGMTVGTFSSASLDPPLVAFMPARDSFTWRKVNRAGHFCVNVLGEHQQDVSTRFATYCEERFWGLDYRTSKLGSPVLNDAVAWIDCRLHVFHEAGDHDIVVGAVEDFGLGDPASPLLSHRGSYNRIVPI